jgi:hypothetical protein
MLLRRTLVAVRQHLFHSCFAFSRDEANTSPQPGITDKVAKESSDSTASSHELHDEPNNTASSGGTAHSNAHKANPVRGWLSGLQWGLTTRQGPVRADNLPEPASKEELKKRAEELNK